MRKQDEQLVLAMYAAVGRRWTLAGQWIDVAQKTPELLAAVRALFKRVPNPPKLGLWLHRRIGVQVGGLQLFGRYSRSADAWCYAVMSPLDVEASEREDAEKAAARARKREEIEIELVRSSRREELKDELAALRAGIVNFKTNRILDIRVQMPHIEAHAPPPILESVHVDSDGGITREALRSRDGSPIREPVQASESPKPDDVPSEPHIRVTAETANDSRLPPWVRAGRQPTKAELAARHARGALGSQGGWLNPGGVVTLNQQTALGVNYCRVAGEWPGGRR